MKGFKLNKKYNHKAEKIFDAFHLDKKRTDELVDQVGDYWYSLPPEKFMVSKILDFIEQQNWLLIEKLYVTERFASIHENEMILGDCNEEMIDFIIKEWKKKDTIVDEEETREYLKHMFKLLMGYRLECLIDTLKDVNNLAEKFGETTHDEHCEDEIEMTPEQMEEQRKSALLNHAVQSIDKALPESFGVAIFCKDGYNIIGKTPEVSKMIQDTIRSGQKEFISDKEQNQNMYQ